MKRSRETEQDYATPVFDGASSDGTIRSMRDLRPSHFVLKIESYSLLCETGVETYESGIFDAGGYEWNLCFYPNGNRRISEVDDHISLYLKIADAASLPCGWEVNVKFTFFMLDQFRDKFFTVEDVNIRRFHATKTEWGVPRLLSLDIFKDVFKGYLVDDCCIIGAEVFVIKRTGRMECLSMVKPVRNNVYAWRIKNFSTLLKSKVSKYSESFTVQGIVWKLLVYMKEDSIAKDEGLAAFLCIVDNESLTTNQKVYAEFKLRVKNQLDIKKNKEHTGKSWFCALSKNFGWSKMISSKDLTNASKGFVLSFS
ncbi:hypothetical protein V6N13_139521 [Hibiscus sabdariffa]|uniref:MATH domain-containing protein n=1 Tax=Hibiscus sabdariffa TaxID=183260 RepID=A0ABR2C9R4_9ROSI